MFTPNDNPRGAAIAIMSKPTPPVPPNAAELELPTTSIPE
jgi:hypothetical protein